MTEIMEDIVHRSICITRAVDSDGDTHTFKIKYHDLKKIYLVIGDVQDRAESLYAAADKATEWGEMIPLYDDADD